MKSTTAPLLAATSKSHRWLAALIVAACAPTLLAWTSGTGTPNATSGFVVAPANRLDDLSFYNCTYPASENYAANIAWTGSVASGIAGTTSVAFKDDVLRRINFYRALSALPADISLDATKSGKDQEAALMMSANNALSHTPPSTWTSYTANGAEAAGNSNIALGTARWTPTCAIVAAETSQLRWYDLGRFAVTTNTPGAEISTDGGATWTSVFIRNGAGLTSALWDPAFISRSYFMRIRPNLGTRWWGDGPLKTVIAQTPSGYAGWVATQHPAANEGPLGDHEKDGILNGVEYAFGLNPTTPNAPSALPLPTRAGNTLTVTFTQPAHIHRRHRRSG